MDALASAAPGRRRMSTAWRRTCSPVSGWPTCAPGAPSGSPCAAWTVRRRRRRPRQPAPERSRGALPHRHRRAHRFRCGRRGRRASVDRARSRRRTGRAGGRGVVRARPHRPRQRATGPAAGRAGGGGRVGAAAVHGRAGPRADLPARCCHDRVVGERLPRRAAHLAPRARADGHAARLARPARTGRRRRPAARASIGTPCATACVAPRACSAARSTTLPCAPTCGSRWRRRARRRDRGRARRRTAGSLGA